MKKYLWYFVTAVIAVIGFGMFPAESMAVEWPIFTASTLAAVGCNSCHFVGSFSMLPLTLGLVVNAASIKEISLNLSKLFNDAFEAAPSNWQKIAMLVPSGGSETSYKWLGAFPKMRKWIGDKYAKALEAFSYSIVNDDFEATVTVDRNDIEDDNLGIYSPLIQSAGESAKQLPDDIVMELANGVFTTKCYDGQFMADNDHPVNGASVSNKGTAKLSSATPALAAGSYGAGRIALMEMKDSEGKSMNIIPNILLVPPALETVAFKLMNADKLNDNSPNPYKGQCEVVVETGLTSSSAWLLLDARKVVKPFVYQERKAPHYVEQTDPQSDAVFDRKEFKFGAEGRAAGGYAFWQLLYASDGSV